MNGLPFSPDAQDTDHDGLVASQLDKTWERPTSTKQPEMDITMKQRKPIAIVLLPFITFGIYSLVWLVKTKNEMNLLGAKIPTAWLLLVPFANIWWYWKYSEGVALVTNEKLSEVNAFLLLLLLGTIGGAVVQNSFNKSSGN